MEMSFLDQWLDARADAPFNLGESGLANLKLRDVLAFKELEALGEMDFEHNPTAGSLALRRKVAALYPGASAENVLITAGATEALLVYFLAQKELQAKARRNKVVVLTPTFHALYDLPKALGFQVCLVAQRFEEGFKLPLERLLAEVDETTLAVMITTPSNPLGLSVPKSVLESLHVALAARGCDLLLDEQYRFLPHQAGHFDLPSLAHGQSSVISFSSPGKCFGAVGLRVGWAVAEEAMVARMNGAKTLTSHAISKLNDRIAQALIDRRYELLAATLGDLRCNRQSFAELVGAYGDLLEWVPPDAGSVCFPRLKGQASAIDFAQRLYEEEGLLLLPGEAFDQPGFFRLRLGLPMDHFSEALEAFERQLSKLRCASAA